MSRSPGEFVAGVRFELGTYWQCSVCSEVFKVIGEEWSGDGANLQLPGLRLERIRQANIAQELGCRLGL